MFTSNLKHVKSCVLQSIFTGISACALTGCASLYLPTGELDDNLKRDWGTVRDLATFYWPYAAMATNVYRSRGQINSSVASVVASPWLREEMTSRINSGDEKLRIAYDKLTIPEAERMYRERVAELCVFDSESRRSSSVNCDQVVRLCAREAEENTWLSGKADKLGPSCTQALVLCRARFQKSNQACRVLLENDLLEDKNFEPLISPARSEPRLPTLAGDAPPEYRDLFNDGPSQDSPVGAATNFEPKTAINRFVSAVPATELDCNYDPHKPRSLREPKVPVHLLEEYGWKPVPELHRETQASGWRVFIPELAIDVWRKTENVQNVPVVEYAIVFRGTTGGGGLWSNLRGMVFMFEPLVWDQYKQARRATAALIDQIDRLHKVSDRLNNRPITQSTKIRYTTVGHSLGGGLAVYIHLREPRISRSVTFNTSPIDGASTLGLSKRVQVQENASLVARPQEPGVPDAQIYRLNELGEPLSSAFPCESGAMWGAEGGPRVQCDRANLSEGGIFSQHNMSQLACKLYARREGLPKDKVDASVARHGL